MRKLISLLLLLLTYQTNAAIAEAIFAGGNFWRLEAKFKQVKGVLTTVTGFDGGQTIDPTYDNVTTGHSDYLVAVRVIYNPEQVSYQQLVDYFWQQIDPSSEQRQFCDEGPQYQTAIFYLNDEQRTIALTSKERLAKHVKTIYTNIRPTTQFYAADTYHQEFYHNHALRYRYYLYRCSREQRIRAVWQRQGV